MNLILGQYLNGESFLYKLDPRLKIMSLILLMISTFIVNSLVVMLGFLFLLLIVLISGKIPLLRLLKGLKPIIFLLSLTFFFQLLFVKEGDIVTSFELIVSTINLIILIELLLIYILSRYLINIGFLQFLFVFILGLFVVIFFNDGQILTSSPFIIFSEGLSNAFYITIRLMIIVTLSTTLTLTTKPTDLNLAIEYLMKPFRFIIAPEEIALIISISLRYIPTLFDEAQKIMMAQASRGVDFKESALNKKVTMIVSLLVPMFIISFKRSDDLASAMEARNFIPGKKRTRLRKLSWKRMDTVGLTVIISVLILLIGVRIIGINI
jgi:energy-coupling factor transport system permease protein